MATTTTATTTTPTTTTTTTTTTIARPTSSARAARRQIKSCTSLLSLLLTPKSDTLAEVCFLSDPVAYLPPLPTPCYPGAQEDEDQDEDVPQGVRRVPRQLGVHSQPRRAGDLLWHVHQHRRGQPYLRCCWLCAILLYSRGHAILLVSALSYSTDYPTLLTLARRTAVYVYFTHIANPL